MNKLVTYAVMLAYLTVTAWPIQVQAQPYDSEYGESSQQSQYGGKPKVAVYVPDYSSGRGYSSDVESALRTATIASLVGSGQYNVIERSDVIEVELKRQAGGAVDDDQLTAFGRQAGAQYVCIADMIYTGYHENLRSGYGKKLENYQVSVRMIDVETAEVLAFGLADAPGVLLLEGVDYAVKAMLRTAQSPNVETNMPKMAVYVAGEKAGKREGNALYSYTLKALFTRSRNLGTFKVVERSDAFTRQLDREQTTQRGGHVDNNQIARLGKQYGIERILVASMENIMNTYNVSARIINIETARVEKASDIRSVDADLTGLRKISNLMVEEMIGITEAEVTERASAEAAKAEVARAEAAVQAKAEAKNRTLGYLLVGGLVVYLIWYVIAHPKEKKGVENGDR